MKGYLANGMLDTTMRVLPVLQTIVASCKTAPKAHHYRMIITQFPMLMGYSYDNGMRHISDNYLISLGLPVSVDAYGDEKLKDKGILRECEQHAKCLTGGADIAAQAKREEGIEIEKKRRDDQAKSKFDQKRSEDQAIVSALCAAAGKIPSEDNLVHCTMAHFATSNANVL